MRAISSERRAILAIVLAGSLTAWRSVTPLIEQQRSHTARRTRELARYLENQNVRSRGPTTGTH
jgi:hypothetical protein